MRIMIDRPAYAKIENQCSKREALAPIKKALSVTKVTRTEKNDAILWDPSPLLTKALAGLLRREQGFARKTDTHNYKVTEESIERLLKHAAEAAD